MGTDLNAITNLTSTQRAGSASLLGNQSAEDTAYLKKYTDFINSQEGSAAMAKRIGGELGIPTLQANATMLQNTMTNLPSTYSKATTGYDVNQNQLARIIGQKSSELAPAVTTAENSLNAANTNMNAQMGYETADQTKALMPYQTEQTMLADRQARETTLFSADNGRELDALVAKINAGITLSEGEKNRAQQLAVNEKSYQNALDQLNTGKTEVVTVGGRKKLINSITGDVISDLGSSSEGGTGTGDALSYLNPKSVTTPANNTNSGFFSLDNSSISTPTWQDPLLKIQQDQNVKNSIDKLNIDWSKVMPSTNTTGGLKIGG